MNGDKESFGRQKGPSGFELKLRNLGIVQFLSEVADFHHKRMKNNLFHLSR